MANQDRFTALYQKVKHTHLPLVVDDERLLVKRGLTVGALKEQVMNRSGQDTDQARAWHLWVGADQLPEDATIADVYAEHGQGGGLLTLRYSSGAEDETAVRQEGGLRLTELAENEVITVKKFPAILGRFDQNDVTVDLGEIQNETRVSISRRHAEIVVSDHQFIIRNLSQSNMLLVDDKPVEFNKQQLLSPGSQIRLGKVTFVGDVFGE